MSFYLRDLPENLRQYVEKESVGKKNILFVSGMQSTHPILGRLPTIYDLIIIGLFDFQISSELTSNYLDSIQELKKTLSLNVTKYRLCKTDPTVAPEGKSTLYVLLPVPNKQIFPTNWQDRKKEVKQNIYNALEKRLGLKDLKENVEVEKIITPDDFEKDYNVYNGAVFNLSHKVMQMMWLRPHNKFEEYDNCYLVGGGTHPGSGLPTIYQSGIIVNDLINKKYGSNK